MKSLPSIIAVGTTMLLVTHSIPMSHASEYLQGIEYISVVIEDLPAGADEIGLSKERIVSKVELHLRRNGIAVWDDFQESKYGREVEKWAASMEKTFENASIEIESVPVRPVIGRLYVHIEVLNHNLNVTFYVISLQVWEDAYLQRFCCPPSQLDSLVLKVIPDEYLANVQMTQAYQMLEDTTLEAAMKRASRATVWESGGLAYGPSESARSQVIDYLEELLDSFANDYLSANG